MDLSVYIYGTLVFAETRSSEGLIIAPHPPSPPTLKNDMNKSVSKQLVSTSSMSQWHGPISKGVNGVSSGVLPSQTQAKSQLITVDNNINNENIVIMKPLSEMPRQVLVTLVSHLQQRQHQSSQKELQPNSEQIVINLEKQLKGTMNKKRRREYFKDALRLSGEISGKMFMATK